MQIRFIRTLLFASLFALVVLCLSATSFAAIGIVVGFAPPPLPIYEQPICPGDGYIWTPGYWAYGDDFDDYYWVPGTWVLAPEVGFLWTPGYWGWGGSGFVFYDGYWGPQVGFYGGINYGFGYFGVGFAGGRWDNGHFFYNRAVSNVNVTVIHNVYNTTVDETTANHVSYNGGEGGITARPTAEEEAAAHERHVAPVGVQTQHQQQAHGDPQQRASANRGRPAIAATSKPGDFKDRGVVAAREAGGTYTPPANRGGNAARAENAPRAESNAPRSSTAGHVRDLPPAERSAAPNTGDAKLDKKYQQQQNKLYAQQEKERQKVTKQQEKEDQKLAKQKNDAAKQQVEQRHQQQTQQLQQKHQQQQQQMQQRMQPAPGQREARTL